MFPTSPKFNQDGAMDRKPQLKEVPDHVVDQRDGVTYIRGKFLGKGGFARCYELTNSRTKELFAGKIVAKTLLSKSYQREKMTQEVQIHRPLCHPHVVKLFHCFEDNDNVYITLELCARRSLMELHKRRRSVTEPEARYFTHHVALAIDYLHDKKIIHRDLKLGNLFLNDELQVKIGDFGLATTVVVDGERKKTLCGTPNYIAPEVLDKKGHSFEVDIWAVGCILYTLLFGKPPFETQSLKDTYSRIKANQYRIPSHAGQTAAALIKHLLSPDPSKRPNIKEVLKHPFFTSGFLPNRLPVSCLTMAPKFTHDELRATGLPSSHGDRGVSPSRVLSPKQIVRQDLLAGGRPLNAVPENNAMEVDTGNAGGDAAPRDAYLGELRTQLDKLLSSHLIENELKRVEDESPEATPIFWVSKWVDYSDKYGIGYQLCDNSVGVLFNDSSKMILDEAGLQMTYVEKSDKEFYHQLDAHPPHLAKKVTLLKYFRSYMNEHLIKAGGNIAKKDGDDLARLPVLRNWFRTRSAIVLHLSNGTLQINYFDDHTKIIVCPLMSAVTYIDEQKNFHVYKFTRLEKKGISKVLHSRLKYAKLMADRLSTAENSRPGSLNENKGSAAAARPPTNAPASSSQRSLPPMAPGPGYRI